MELISIEWHYDYATVSRQIVHSISRAPNANDRSHKLYLALLLVWLMIWLRSQSSRQSHQHNTDNLANSTTWQQTALQSVNSTTSTNTLSEITVDRYSNIQLRGRVADFFHLCPYPHLSRHQSCVHGRAIYCVLLRSAAGLSCYWRCLSAGAPITPIAW